MLKESGFVNGYVYTRISKKRARDLYESGGAIYLLPDKVRLGNSWIQPVRITREIADRNFPEIADFDKRVTAFEYYNCQYNETGKRVKFFEGVRIVYE